MGGNANVYLIQERLVTGALQVRVDAPRDGQCGRASRCVGVRPGWHGRPVRRDRPLCTRPRRFNIHTPGLRSRLCEHAAMMSLILKSSQVAFNKRR